MFEQKHSITSAAFLVSTTSAGFSGIILFKYNKFVHQFSEHAEASAPRYQSGPAPKNGRNFATSNTQNIKVGVSLKYMYSSTLDIQGV